MKLLKNQQGLTLIELLIVITVTTFFTGLVLYFGISYWRYSYMLEADSETLITRLNAQDLLRKDISTSSGLIIQNSIPDAYAENPDPDIVGDDYWIPVHAVPGTISATGTGTTPLLYYKRFSVDASGTYIMNGVLPYEDEYVLYLDKAEKKIRLRTIAHPSASGNKLLTSCPPEAASASCPEDKVIASNLASVTLGYFSRSGNPVDWTSVYDPDIGQYIGPDYPTVEVVEFTLNITKKPIFQTTGTTQNETVIRIALRNT